MLSQAEADHCQRLCSADFAFFANQKSNYKQRQHKNCVITVANGARSKMDERF